MKPDLATRARLVAAGERLFAERGFRKVTVREICRAARANVAAINYHFGDKLGLYRTVLHSAVDRIRATNEAARKAGEGRAPREQLYLSIQIFVTRLLTADSDTVHRLIQREISDPTPALDALIEQGIRPRKEFLAGLVAEILGVRVSDARVLRCVASIQTQSIAYLRNPIAPRVGLMLRPTTAADIDAIADHIAAFSVGGVEAVAAAIRRRPRRGSRVASRARDRGRAGRSSS